MEVRRRSSSKESLEDAHLDFKEGGVGTEPVLDHAVANGQREVGLLLCGGCDLYREVVHILDDGQGKSDDLCIEILLALIFTLF